ncbi:MAG: hypothetical protein V3S65_08600 [Candidatus Aminicenantaceae bacterium]
MNLKRLLTNISLAAIILIFASSGFSTDNIVQSIWTAQPPTIDGMDDDWGGDGMAFEKKVQVDYAVRNDAQSMYVLFVFKNPKYLSSINATGITLYYNTEGKKKKDHAYRFIKKKVTGEELLSYLKERGEVLTERQIQSIEPTNIYSVYMTERTGKKDKKISVAASIPAVLNPSFKTSKKGDAFIYEFRVPLLRSETSPRGMDVKPGHKIKIGFEWGGMTEKLMKQLAAQPGRGGDDVSTEGRAQSMIDSRRGGATGAPASASRRMPKKHSFWIDINLAQDQ